MPNIQLNVIEWQKVNKKIQFKDRNIIQMRISYLYLMNKFNKKLTISVPQDSVFTNENESPSVPESGMQDKQGLLQFREFRDGADSQFGDLRNQAHGGKINFVEFQEFNVNNYQAKEKKINDQEKKSTINKRSFMIQVPDRDEERVQDRKFKASRLTDNYIPSYNEDKFKQPPAPSKGSKFNKVFVFPATPPLKKQEKQKQKETSDTKQQLKKSFERQRQQFYKQKSRLQKQLLIKNGQIEMLHKLLTQNFAIPNHRNIKNPQYYEYSQGGLQDLETILLQKDLQINQLLQKISQLNNLLTRKAEQHAKKIVELSNIQSLAESLKNQLYIYERKEESEKLTKKFYHLQKQKPQEDIEQFSLQGANKQFGSKGLQNLYRRIEMVRQNRIQFDSRNKIKSDVSYSQTTKNRPKGTFDFKGKTFQASSNLNKTRMY